MSVSISVKLSIAKPEFGVLEGLKPKEWLPKAVERFSRLATRTADFIFSNERFRHVADGSAQASERVAYGVNHMIAGVADRELVCDYFPRLSGQIAERFHGKADTNLRRIADYRAGRVSNVQRGKDLISNVGSFTRAAALTIAPGSSLVHAAYAASALRFTSEIGYETLTADADEHQRTLRLTHVLNRARILALLDHQPDSVTQDHIEKATRQITKTDLEHNEFEPLQQKLAKSALRGYFVHVERIHDRFQKSAVGKTSAAKFEPQVTEMLSRHLDELSKVVSGDGVSISASCLLAMRTLSSVARAGITGMMLGKGLSVLGEKAYSMIESISNELTKVSSLPAPDVAKFIERLEERTSTFVHSIPSPEEVISTFRPDDHVKVFVPETDVSDVETPPNVVPLIPESLESFMADPATERLAAHFSRYNHCSLDLVKYEIALSKQECAKRGIPFMKFIAAMAQESSLNPKAAGDLVNGVPQSYGLFQIYLKYHPGVTAAEAMDPTFNIKWTADHWQDVKERLGISWDDVVIIHNQGEPRFVDGVITNDARVHLGKVLEREGRYANMVKQLEVDRIARK